MGVRGIIRDLLGIYLGFEIARAALVGRLELSTPVVVSGIVLLVLGIWFILERIGIMAHYSFD